MSELEDKVEKHSIQIKELQDEVDFKKWKIDSLIEKIDNLTTVVQQIQLNQLKDDSDIKERLTTIETDIKERVTSLESTLTTLKWVSGISLSAVGILIAYVGLFM